MPRDKSDSDYEPEHRDEEFAERLVIFVLPLPDPLPIPHGSTYTTFFPWPIKALEGIPLSPEVNTPPFPDEMTGKQFASVKFWQVKEPVSQSDIQAMSAANKIVDALNPRARHGEVPHAKNDDAVHYRTVVEMATVATRPPEGKPFIQDGIDQTDPFDRCFTYLQQIFRGYRLSEGALVPQLTYQRLLPYVIMLQRDLYDRGSPSVTSIVLLNHTNINDVPAPEPLTAAGQERMNLFLTMLLQGNPFALFAERSLEARTALERDGDYGNAVVQCALSVEVLLDGLLGVMLWEESLPAPNHQAAAEVLSKPLASKVKQEFHTRLGGYWGLNRPGVLLDWSDRIAYLRGRVVHRSHRPSEAEARRALEAADKLETFVKHRLARSATNYSRTALMLLGRPGLERHGAWKRVERFVEEAADKESSWSLSYSAWRDAVDRLVRL